MMSVLKSCFAVAAAAVSLQAFAQGPAPARFSDAIAASRSLLAANRFADARSMADRIIGAALASPLSAEEVRYALASATACRALAQRRLMQSRRGEWDWYVAVSLSPEIAAQWRNEFADARAFEEVDASITSSDRDRLPPGTRIQPPLALTRPAPQYPLHARRLQLEGPVIVECVIDAAGHPHRPTLKSRDVDPSLAFSALESLADSEFKPAMYGDKPAIVLFDLKIMFKLNDPPETKPTTTASGPP